MKDKNSTKIKLALDRGKRLKLARNISRLTRKNMCDRYGINPNTIHAWEKGINCLSEKNAQNLINIFSQEGLNITLEWLLYGNPSSLLSNELKFVYNNDESNADLKNILAVDGELKFFEEIEYFRKNNANAVAVLISDDALSPIFSVGDYVGGLFLVNKNLNTLIGEFCIIALQDGTTLTRKIFKQTDQTSFCIGGINPFTKLPEPGFFNCEISSAAKITRHWLIGKSSVYETGTIS